MLGTDDTGLKVLDKKKSCHIKRGHIWAYVGYERGSPKAVVFAYTPTWEGKYPRQFLKDRKGYVQGDGYPGLAQLFTGGPSSCTNIGCWMHARRYCVTDRGKSSRHAQIFRQK